MIHLSNRHTIKTRRRINFLMFHLRKRQQFDTLTFFEKYFLLERMAYITGNVTPNVVQTKIPNERSNTETFLKTIFVYLYVVVTLSDLLSQ